MPRTYKTDAIVLGSHKLGEADRVVSLLTAERGKVPTVVKGVRKVKSRFGGRLEPFSRIQAQLYEGRNLHTLTGADTIETNAVIRDRPEALKAGLAVIDMFSRAIPELEHRPRTYNLLASYLREAAASATGGAAAHTFRAPALGAQLKLLLLAGYLPHLASCAVCGREEPLHRFSAATGGALCPDCPGEAFNVSPETVSLMRVLLEQPLSKATRMEAGNVTVHETWLCIRELCRFYLGCDLKLEP